MVLAVGEPPPKGAERPVRRFVAIERLQVPGAANAIGAIRARLDLLAQVKDPRFVEVVDLLPGEPAIVTEYVHGVSLARALDELRKAREQVFTEAAVEIGVELAEALHRAYSTPGRNGEPLGLVHERLRPAAVMLCPDGAVRILDMAIGRSLALPGSADGDAQLGLAPEQVRKEDVDHRADLFSTGLILYELLMSQPAWRAAEALSPGVSLQALIAAGDLREASRNLEQTLPALGPILRKLLQGRPDDRYRTGAELLVDLRRQLFRERGSYLKEFCEFYFGAIQKLEPAPDLEEHGAGKGRRRSIEERLRESLAREAEPTPAAPKRSPASPPVASAGRGQEGADPPRPPPPRLVSPRADAPSVPQGEGDSMSTGGKKAPPRPPVGGPASRAQPFTPPAGGTERKAGTPLKVVGERRPDETGMLEMVPLSGDRDKAEAKEDPSATAFFAIPAPKADRSRPAAPPPPPSAGGPAGVGAPGLGPPPGPPMARPPIGGPVAQTPAQPIVQGPVVSYGNTGASSPFQVSGPTPAAVPPGDQGDRVRSNRVYAILVGVFLLVAVALVAAVWLIPKVQKEEVKTPPPTTQPTVVVEKTAKVEQDTAPPPAPVPTPKPKAKATTPKPAPAPSNGPGTLSVVLGDATQATAVEVVCPSGFRQRTALAGGKGSIASVPQEKCTMYFKGGAPAQYAPVGGGRTYNCSIVGTTAVCK